MKLSKLQTAACLVLGFLMLGGGLFSQPATAQTYTVLYTFTGTPDGKLPSSGLLRVSSTPFSTDIYGTTTLGGTNNLGSIFKLSATGHETVLYSFAGGADGEGPSENGVLVRDSAGNLYGNTVGGGASNCGVVFKLAPNGVETVLHTFTGMGLDGCNPYGGLIRDAAGNFYGIARSGGSSQAGVVFTMTAGVFNTLYSFTGGADGGQPYGDLVFDPAGNLYGVTVLGGGSNKGVIFELTPSGQESVLYSFTGGADGGTPVGLTRDSSGNLYGMTQAGGVGSGVVFELSSSGVYSVLHSFAGADGALPTASPTRDPAGNLYGTTIFGGADGDGVVFKLRSDGTYTVLHNFTGGADGSRPFGGDLIWTPSASLAGTLYGSASHGGSSSSGVLFGLTTQ